MGSFLGNEQASIQIDNGISQAIRSANKISMSKNVFGNRIKTIVTGEKNSFKRNTVDVGRKYGYFKQQICGYGVVRTTCQKTASSIQNKATILRKITKGYIMRTIS